MKQRLFMFFTAICAFVAVSYAATITGNVTDASGSPVNRALVLLESTDQANPFFQNTNTDENGDYTLSNIPVGEYVVIAQSGMNGVEENVSITNASGTTTLNLQIGTGSEQVEVSGTVIDSVSENELSGIAVKIRQGGPGGYVLDSADTDVNGNFSFTIPRPSGFARYSLVVSDEEYMTKTVNLGTLREDQTGLVVRLANVQTGTMSIFVGKATDSTALNDASVSAVLSTNNETTYSGTTNGQGWVVFEEVVSGTYRITASMNGYNSSTITRVVSANENDSGYVYLTEATGIQKELTGIVRVSGSGENIEDARVELTIEQNNTVQIFFDSTNSSGDYEITGIPRNVTSATLKVTHESYETFTTTVDLSDQTTTVNVELTPASSIANALIGKVFNNISVVQNGNILKVQSLTSPATVELYTLNGSLVHRAHITSEKNIVELARTPAQSSIIAVIRQDNMIKAQTLLLK